MTDARLPEKMLMDARVNRLPADAWRSYTHSLMWAVSNRTEGFIKPEDLPMIPMFRAGDETILARSGLWTTWGQGWYIDRFEFDQSTKAQLEAAERARAHARERKSRQRARERSGGDDPGGGTPPDHDVTRDVTVDDTGKDRTGKDRIKYFLPHQSTRSGMKWRAHHDRLRVLPRLPLLPMRLFVLGEVGARWPIGVEEG